MSRTNPKSLEFFMQEQPSEFAAFIGIDWADRKHDVCLQVAGADTFPNPQIRRSSFIVCLRSASGRGFDSAFLNRGLSMVTPTAQAALPFAASSTHRC
jgi:hypothetical protein